MKDSQIARAAWQAEKVVILSPAIFLANEIIEGLNLSEGGKWIPETGKKLIEIFEGWTRGEDA